MGDQPLSENAPIYDHRGRFWTETRAFRSPVQWTPHGLGAPGRLADTV